MDFSAARQLTDDERQLINKYLAFYQSLDQGHRIPKTEAQTRFVDVCRGRAMAKTLHEKAYLKYRYLERCKKAKAQKSKIGKTEPIYCQKKSKSKPKRKKILYPSPMKALLEKSVWLHSRDERLLIEMKCIVDDGGKLNEKQRTALWQMFNRLQENQMIRFWRG
jgi:uncharacterized protein YifE (UPF0438 family)